MQLSFAAQPAHLVLAAQPAVVLLSLAAPAAVVVAAPPRHQLHSLHETTAEWMMLETC
jgi:hypothetical protein